MKFKNLKTGNVVITDDKSTIALMQKSDRYVAVTKKGGKEPAGKPTGNTDEKQNGDEE